MNNIKINYKNYEIINDSKFKNIKLYDYQIKTIKKLLEHEKGQMKIKKKYLKWLFEEIYIKLNSIKERKYFNKKINKLKNSSTYNLGYNIGVLSNKVGSGKTYIILGMIMSKEVNSIKILKKYKTYDIYNNSNICKDICSIISDYLIEDNDFILNTSNKKLKDSYNLFNTNNEKEIIEIYETKRLKKIKNLIIVPHNLYQQWYDEINLNTSLNCYFIKTKKNLIDIKNNIENKDLILCNVNKLKDFLEIIRFEYNINRLFIDEADTINLSNFPEINSDFLWLITTTYKRLLKPKNQGFINNLFKGYYKTTDKVYKDILNNITYTFDADYINKKVDLKNPNKNYIVVKNNFINKLFYKLKVNNYYKFINSYDYKSLFSYMLKSINFNEETYIHIVNYLINKFYKSNYKTIDDLVEIKYINENTILFIFIINQLYLLYTNDILMLVNNHHSYKKQIYEIDFHILNCIECKLNNNNKCKIFYFLKNEKEKLDSYIKKKYNKIIVRKNRLSYIKEEFIRNGYCLDCLYKHNITEKCIDSHIKITFDMYNIYFMNYDFIIEQYIEKIKLLYNIKNNQNYEKIEYINNITLSNDNLKIKKMIDLLKNDIKNKKRSLLFSDNYNFFDYIKLELIKNNIKYKILKGNSNVINSILKKYKNYEIDVLLLNMKFSGSGLNLQMSDNIYIMNMIDKNTETQVIGRVNRINKNNNFEIYYFFNDDEYELYNQDLDILNDNSDKKIIIENI